MATTSTPVYSAPHNGIIGDASATAGAGQVNQFLGTHGITAIYQGNPILTPAGAGAAAWTYSLQSQDVDQPFTMSGTRIGRVQIPVLPTGAGADLLVSLCSNTSGHPGTMLTQSRVPAAVITQLAAESDDPNSSAGPLATAAGNALFYAGWQSVPWSPPATGATGGLATAQMAQSGNFMIFAGGVNAANGNSSATVAKITWLGGTSISATVAGPALPQPLLSGGFTATPDCLCYAGGVNVNGATNTVVSTVYVASWDPTAGAIGTWSIQASLPQALVSPGMAAYGPTDTVYVVGGSTNYAGETALVSTVYYATVSGQQITAWTAGPPLPIPVADPTVAVVGDWLIVAGGFTASGNGSAAVYYAPINPATGAPGSWVPGPPVPAGLYVEGAAAVSETAIAWPQSLNLSTGFVTQDTLTLTWDSNGPGVWSHQIGPLAVLNQDQVAAMMPTGAGAYQIFNFQDSAYLTAALLPVPGISVPLPTSGLTNGATYHILLQQQGGTLTDYLSVLTDLDVFSGNPTLLDSNRGAYAWSAAPAGTAMPLVVSDMTAPTGGPPSIPLHLWADSGARITTFVSATTPDQRILGVCEATRQSVALNANQGFETGLAPWTWSGGSAVQSATQVFEGAYAAQVTPLGSASSVFLQSELLPCMPGQSVTVAGWMWFTNAVTSNASMSVSWYTRAGTFISTSASSVSAPAATWTQLSNTFTAPATAYQFTINPTLSGTPAAGQVFYVDTAHGHATYTGPQTSTVVQIEYASTWPAAAAPEGVGTVQLA